MFTGIIESVGLVDLVVDMGDGKRFTYRTPIAKDLSIDDSVSINGCCQTVIACDNDTFSTQVVAETLRKTNFGNIKYGDKVNLERSVTLSARLDGHIVQGHVDTVATVLDIIAEETSWLIRVELETPFQKFIVGRGSVALNGISLTVARDEGNAFTVAIIPYTFDHTNLHTLKVGDKVNLEFDILGKYVIKYLSSQGN